MKERSEGDCCYNEVVGVVGVVKPRVYVIILTIVAGGRRSLPKFLTSLIGDQAERVSSRPCDINLGMALGEKS